MLHALVLTTLLLAPQPKGISHVVQVSDGSGIGFGTQISPSHILTAAHMLKSTQITWRDGANNGVAEVVWKDDKNDTAVIKLPLGAKTFPNWALAAKKPAETGDKVYYRILLFGETSVSWTEGIVLGIDEEGDLVIGGWFHPGTSGTGIFNSNGELVGVMNSGVNWSAARSVGPDMLQNLFIRTSFPPAMIATPINKIKGFGGK